MDKPKPAVEARTKVTDHSTPRKREAPNLSLENRLRLARGAAGELGALAEGLRKPVMSIISAEHFTERVAIALFLDRMKLVADALMKVADPEDDEHHDAAELASVLRFAPGLD